MGSDSLPRPGGFTYKSGAWTDALQFAMTDGEEGGDGASPQLGMSQEGTFSP